MSVKTPSEKFLMTVPKPIHDWLSDEAEKLGVTVQDRVRVMLEEEKGHSRHRSNLLSKEIEEQCYQLGKKVYDEFATERKRLTIIQVPSYSDDKEYNKFYLEHGIDDSLILPVIHKNFQPFLPDKLEDTLNEYHISRAAKQVAELENKLLSVCDDGDKLFEALPFTCGIRFKGGEWVGWFRICLNSEKTPTMADTIRVTS